MEHSSGNRPECECYERSELWLTAPVRTHQTIHANHARCLKRAVENKEIALETDVERLAKFLTTEYRLLVMLAASGEPYSELKTRRLMSASLFFCIVDN